MVIPPRHIIITRNPKDTLLSLYYHMNGKKVFTSVASRKLLDSSSSIPAHSTLVLGLAFCLPLHDSYSGDWNDFWQQIVRRRIENTDFFDWTLPWWRAHQQGEIKALWVHYEDVIQDLRGYVQQIVDFLGWDVSPEVIERTAAASHIDAMKENPKANCEWIQYKDTSAGGHLRVGGVGNWRDAFTDEQNAEFEQMYTSRMQGTGLTYDFGEGQRR